MPQNHSIANDSTIAVVGLGYVGLPLVLAFARQLNAVGIDIDEAKVVTLREGGSYIKHIDGSEIAAVTESGRFHATSDFSTVRDCDAIILCVPTPLDDHLAPDLGFVVATIDAIVPYLRKGHTVSLETTYPGTTAEELVPRIEAQGLTVGVDVHVVYSPEREDPGNPDFAATNIPKVIGGHTPACLHAGLELYGSVFEKTVPVSSCKVAELTKLLENIYRAVNIGLVNEMKVAADRMGIDIWEVIQAASTKPFGFKPFFPGPGLGGHCIPIDPFYLTWKAREHGVNTRFIELAGEINRGMPDYVVTKTVRALNDFGKATKGSRVLIMGLAYKPDVDDMRESPAFHLMDKLKELGAEVSYFDPHVPAIAPTREHAHWTGTQSIPWTEQAVSANDCAIVATNHKAFALNDLADWLPLIIDTRNAMAGVESGECQVIKA